MHDEQVNFFTCNNYDGVSHIKKAEYSLAEKSYCRNVPNMLKVRRKLCGIISPAVSVKAFLFSIKSLLDSLIPGHLTLNPAIGLTEVQLC